MALFALSLKFLHAGPNVNYGDMATGCGPGQQVPDQYEKDKLIRVVRGNYYGQPNLKRGATDARQCVWRGASLPSGNGYTAPMMKLSSSSNGIVEFDSDHFNGQMRGNLIVSKYNGPLNRIILSPDGTSVQPTSNPAIVLGGIDTLAVVQAPNGLIIDTRYAMDNCFFYRPNEPTTSAMIVKAVFPRRGPLAGGTKFSVYGVNFAAGSTVTVGGNACTNVNVVSPKKIECRLPGGTLGLKDIVVSSGGSSDTFAKGYRFITGRP
jgi:IPT/TIG domain